MSSCIDRYSGKRMGGAAAVVATLLALVGLVSAQEAPKPGEDVARDATAAKVPASPEDPVAAKAFAVLDRHCAQCHQSGKLKGARAAGRLANVLDLASISADRSLVRPGNPDGSELYTMLLVRAPPHEVLTGGEEPSVEEIQAIREWIQALPLRQADSCKADQVLGADKIADAIAKAVEAVPEEKRKSLRFISLAPLYNACRSRALVPAYAQAVAKLVNGLTWAKEPYRLTAVDQDGALLKIDLEALGLVPAHWERMASGYPYADSPAALIRATGSQHPVIRGDWLADRMQAPGIYGDVLGLPARLAELKRLIKLDMDASSRAGTAVRGAIKESVVVRGGRVIERHPVGEGAFWIAYDFAGTTDRRNIAEHPLGPNQSIAGRPTFRHDGSRVLFQLPNGFVAYAVFDARGDRLLQVAEGIDRSDRAGASCAGCHRAGVVRFTDEIRALAETDRAGFRPELREAVLATYAPRNVLDREISNDIVSFARAMQAAGITPSLSIEGHEPVDALADAYARPVDAERLAAEAGLAPAELNRRLAALTGDMRLLAIKLRQGVVSRAQANRILAVIGEGAGGGDAAQSSPPDQGPGLDLVLWSDKDRYKPGDLVRFGARVSADCNLTLISLDTVGRATVLFPNEFEQTNLVPAGRDISLPGNGAPYQFRAKDRGRETLVGICTTAQKLPEGINPDYERQRFTMLGNWANFVSQAYSEEAGERRAAAQKAPEPKVRGRRPARSKQEAARGEARKRELQVRTAITYEIE